MSSNNIADRRARLSKAKQKLLQKRLQGNLKQPQAQQIKPRPQQEATVLSFAQRRIWFLQHLNPTSGAYNIHGARRLSGPLNVAALQKSLNEVIKRHEVLRTVFPPADRSQPVQVVRPPHQIELPQLDLRPVAKQKQSERVDQLIIEAAQKPFDLAQGPLLRMQLLQLGTNEHVLISIFHHIIFDEWSADLFWKELGAVYKSLVAQTPPSLPELPIQYADYAYWHNQRLQKGVYEKQLAYWQQKLQGDLPVLDLPTDHPRPSPQTFAGAMQSGVIPPAIAEALRQIGQEAETTMFMTLLAAFGLLLHRYTAQNDVIIGTPIANRNRPELKDLIGVFLNTLALRLNFQAGSTFQTLLAQIRQIVLEAFANQEMPFEELVENLQPERYAGYNPIFQVMFVYQKRLSPPLAFPDLVISPLPLVDSRTAKFDLTLFIIESEGRLEVAIEYNTDLFEPATITRMLGHFQTLLAGIVTNPQQPVATLPLLTQPERHQLLVEWTNTQADYPQERGIHHLIEAQAQQSPETIAVQSGDDSLTYEALDRRASQLAAYLQAQAVGPGTLVGICLERSLEMVVTFLGVLKAGGAYVPLDPGYPPERLRFILEDTQAPVLLTQAHLRPQLPPTQAKIICVDRDWETIATAEKTSLTPKSGPDDRVYVIYTSGSTGQPKGVPISHRNLVHSTLARLNYYPDPIESFLLLSSFAFDSSVVGIFGTLCQGGTLTLPPQGGEQEIGLIANLIAEHHISHLLSLPSLYNLLLTYSQADQLDSLKVVMVAGEVCPRKLVDLHYQTLPKTTLYNEYGPTEGTVWSTVYKIPADEPRNQIPIGRPIPNMQTYILDTYQQPVPIGVPGELHIGGAGLARGYLNRPDLTAEKFIPHPFDPDPAARLYRTGDLVRYLPDGNIDFLGRVDNQVKIRGYRIELDEISQAMKQHPTVDNAVVIAIGEGAKKQLVGYPAGKLATLPSAEDLRDFLQHRLPDSMIPLMFVPLATLPLTPNGKIDRQALPQPDLTALTAARNYTPPRDVLEFQLTRIWEDVLTLERVGIYDNFFELGGQSLLAVRLVNEIDQTLNQKLPLVMLFQAPTIAQLADILREEGWDISQRSLVSIQAGDLRAKPPLFMVPGNLGNVFTDLGLVARHLKPDQSLYGLQDGLNIPSQVEAMAAYYVREIQAVQAKGPYFLGGICSGGIIAYEMAQQLQKQEQEVLMLALVEAFPHDNRAKSLWTILQRFGRRLSGNHHAQADNTVTTEPENEPEKKMSLSERSAFLQLKAKVVTNMVGMVRYTLKPYSGSIDLYFCEESLASSYKPHLSWQRVAAGGIKMHHLPGTHNDITGDRGAEISEEVMADLARQLTARMEEILKKS